MSLFDLDATFFRDHWRQRPTLLRGVARALIPEAPSVPDLDELRARPGIRCITDDASCWFYRMLRDELPLVERLVTAGRELFEWEHVACDLVRTVGPASIGCHFDEDDNFSIQLIGSKRWRLSPPDTLPADLLRRRMLKEPDIGVASLGPEVMELRVEPGDVLYLPQSWIHWGESTGDSTSISLVIESRTFHLDFAPAIADALRRAPGWSLSIPAGPGSRARRERDLDALVQQTFTPRAAERTRPWITPRAPTPGLSMNMDRVRAFIATAPPVPTEGFVLPAEGVETHRALRALLARRTLRRLLRTIATRAESTLGALDRILYQQCADALLGASDPQLERICTEPELIALAAIATDGEPRHEDPVAAELARSLIPELSAARIDSVPFSLLPDLDGGFTVRGVGVRIVADQPHEELVARIAGGAWEVFAGGRFRAPQDAPGLRVEPLPRLRGEGPVLSPSPTALVVRHVRDQELASADPVAFERFVDAMGSGAERLAAAWPAAWREVAEGIRWLLPLPDRGLDPYNYSVHAFRGMVVTSPRRDHRCAQTLVHEAGHNRLSTILDLLELCADPNQVVVSPVVDALRPMSFVFHGCFAFAQDLAFTTRLLEQAPAAERASAAGRASVAEGAAAAEGASVAGQAAAAEGASMQRYLDEVRRKVSAALGVIEREAKVTAVGATILSEIAGIVGR